MIWWRSISYILFYLKKFICSSRYLLNIVSWLLLLLVHLPFYVTIGVSIRDSLNMRLPRSRCCLSGSSVSLPIPFSIMPVPSTRNASVLRSQVNMLCLYKSPQWVIYIKAVYDLQSLRQSEKTVKFLCLSYLSIISSAANMAHKSAENKLISTCNFLATVLLPVTAAQQTPVADFALSVYSWQLSLWCSPACWINAVCKHSGCVLFFCMKQKSLQKLSPNFHGALKGSRTWRTLSDSIFNSSSVLPTNTPNGADTLVFLWYVGRWSLNTALYVGADEICANSTWVLLAFADWLVTVH